MKISTKGRYGLRLMLELAKNYGKGNVTLKYISKKQGISEKYLEQIINSLNKAGLVKSERGSQGGYRLAYSPDKITAGNILRVLEGPLAPVPCIGEGIECEKREFCQTYPLWKELNDAIEKVLDGKTLESLMETDNYCI